MNTSTAHGRPPAEPRRGPRHHRRAARAVGIVCAATLATSGTVALALPASSSPGQSVTSLRDLEAEDLAATIAGRGITVRSATFSGNDVQAGRFSGMNATGLARGVALTTGSVIDADPQSDADTDFSASAVLGPNEKLTTTGDLGGAGARALDRLVGVTTYDAAVLTMRVVPSGNRISLSYVFGSEEYAGWSEQEFADAFAIWVNGTPCSTVPRTRDLVSTATVNASSHPELYVENFAPNDPGAGTHDTELNAFTTVLTCDARVTPRRVSTVRVAVADTRDGQLDSTVLLGRDSLVSSRGNGPQADRDHRDHGRWNHGGQYWQIRR
jgi:hypothetical protein